MIKIYLRDEDGQVLRILRDPTVPRIGDVINSPYITGLWRVAHVQRAYDEVETLSHVDVHAVPAGTP